MGQCRHVLPVNDLIEHEDVGEDCVCGPDVELVVSDVDGSDGWVVKHHSLDGRELLEPDYEG